MLKRQIFFIPCLILNLSIKYFLKISLNKIFQEALHNKILFGMFYVHTITLLLDGCKKNSYPMMWMIPLNHCQWITKFIYSKISLSLKLENIPSLCLVFSFTRFVTLFTILAAGLWFLTLGWLSDTNPCCIFRVLTAVLWLICILDKNKYHSYVWR